MNKELDGHQTQNMWTWKPESSLLNTTQKQITDT